MFGGIGRWLDLRITMEVWKAEPASGRSFRESILMKFFGEYLSEISGKVNAVDLSMLVETAMMLKSASQKGGKVIVAGNGGSAAIASHISVDLTNSAKVRAITFNESDLITCLANDYGYEKWLEKALEYYADPEDAVVLISSSGRSENIINAADKARDMGLNIITFSGFDSDNLLREMGDINFWVDSHNYNVVETVHNIWLASLVDKLAYDLAAMAREVKAVPIVALDTMAEKSKEKRWVVEK